MKKNKGLVIVLSLIIVVLIISLIIALYLLMSKDNNTKNINNNDNNNVNDNLHNDDNTIGDVIEEQLVDVIETDYFKAEKKCIKGKYSTCYTKVEFINLPKSVTKEFEENNSKWIESIYSYINGSSSEADDFDHGITNEFIYEIHDDILSVFMVVTGADIQSYSYYTGFNYDIKTGKALSTRELLERYGVTSEKMYDLILKNIATTANNPVLEVYEENFIDYIETITLDEFKSRIPTYINKLKGNYDDIQLYILDGKLKCAFIQREILSNIKIEASHGAGIKWEVQTVALN